MTPRCVPFLNLVEFIEVNVELEEELGEFEGSFDRNEIVDMKIIFMSYYSPFFFTLICILFLFFILNLYVSYKICEIQVVDIWN
jgi:hypothetical protein